MKTGKQKYLSGEEFKKLLSVIPGDRDYLLFFLLGNLGLRVGEGIRLRAEDIDFSNRCLHTPTLKQGTKKGIVHGKIKRGKLPDVYIDLPLDDVTLKMLTEYIKLYKVANWLFPYKDKLPLPDWQVMRAFKGYAKKAGLDPCYSVHSLRHFKGVSAYSELKDIRAVQLLLRHKSISSTQVYTEMSLDQKRKISEKLKIVT